MGAGAHLDRHGAPGLGAGWIRVARAVAEAMPPAEIARIWLFAPVRRGGREWGTAVVARRVAGGRARVYTAGYLLVTRGRERGQGKIVLEEVGESPAEVVDHVIRGVQERAGEAEPPVEIERSAWYGGERDQPAAQG